MSSFLKTIFLALLPVLIVLTIVLTLPINKQFAYHFIKGNCYNHGAWVYDRIFENDTPVDVAFIGSSRTLHAVNEREVEQKLAADLNVVNLGYCQMGRNFQHIVLKDLVKEKTPKLVVIEVTEDEQQYSHQSFGYVANSMEILKAPLNQSYFLNAFKSVVMKWEFLKARFLFNQLNYKIDLGKYGYGSSDRMVTAEELDRNQKFWERRLKRNHDSMIGKLKDRYPFYYLEKSIELLEKSNIDYCFLFIPTSYVEIEKSVFDSVYNNFAPVYSISPSKYKGLNNWMDAAHFNNTGSLKVADEIADVLKKELCLPGN